MKNVQEDYVGSPDIIIWDTYTNVIPGFQPACLFLTANSVDKHNVSETEWNETNVFPIGSGILWHVYKVFYLLRFSLLLAYFLDIIWYLNTSFISF